MPMPRFIRLRPLLLAGALAAPLTGLSEGRAQAPAQQPAAREIEIVVDGGGYKPARIALHAGERVRLKFVRRESAKCAQEVLIPELHIRRDLPLDKPVLVDLPVLVPGEYEFRCGMNMVRGTLLVLGRHHD